MAQYAKGNEFQNLSAKFFTLDATSMQSGRTDIIGSLPAGAVVTAAQIIVLTAFNGGATNTINVGDQATATSYASASSLATITRSAITAPVRSVQAGVNDQIRYTPTFTTQPTVGRAMLYIEFAVIGAADGVN
jgi:hypothetical protein